MSSSASFASPPAQATEGDAPRVLVWDLPTRLFHWLLAASFFGAYLLSESERWVALHAMLGYTAIGLVAFRLLWGMVGTRYARFTGFAWSPRAAAEYLKSLFSRRPQHYVGHNPAASWAIVALLGLVAATALSGWATLNQVGGEWMEDVHEVAANATLALVAFHVAAVVVSSLLHRENLVLAMVSGFKRARDAVPAAGQRWLVGGGLLALIAAFWFGFIPAPGIDRGTGFTALTTPASNAKADDRRGRRHHEHDD
jgi:cytochrome b